MGANDTSIPPMARVDVDYRGPGAVAACVLFRAWADDRPASEAVVRIDAVAPYEPGRFYRRELPCLLSVLGAIDERPGVVIIDGYVWLGDEHDPGLGAHLHGALGGRAAVIGVAKTRFLRARLVREVLRGGSRSPLYVTAAGMDVSEAADCIRGMHGPFRIPTLLKRVDQLCRGRAVGA
jgi:deoxyribonuclease V